MLDKLRQQILQVQENKFGSPKVDEPKEVDGLLSEEEELDEARTSQKKQNELLDAIAKIKGLKNRKEAGAFLFGKHKDDDNLAKQYSAKGFNLSFYMNNSFTLNPKDGKEKYFYFSPEEIVDVDASVKRAKSKLKESISEAVIPNNPKEMSDFIRSNFGSKGSVLLKGLNTAKSELELYMLGAEFLKDTKLQELLKSVNHVVQEMGHMSSGKMLGRETTYFQAKMMASAQKKLKESEYEAFRDLFLEIVDRKF